MQCFHQDNDLPQLNRCTRPLQSSSLKENELSKPADGSTDLAVSAPSEAGIPENSLKIKTLWVDSKNKPDLIFEQHLCHQSTYKRQNLPLHLMKELSPKTFA